MKRILIVKFWALGDILMATPLLAALKRQWPDGHIAWLVDSQNAALLEGQPLLDEVITLDTGAWRRRLRKGNLAAWLGQARGLRAQIRKRGFDAVINCHPDKWWSALLCVAPVRVALYPARRVPVSRLFYTHALSHASRSHNTDSYLRTLEPLGVYGPHDRRMSLTVSDRERHDAQAFLAGQAGYDPAKPCVVLHPGTSQESKCWPAASYAALAACLAPRLNVIVTGSPKETALAREIAALMPLHSPPPILAAGQGNSLRFTLALVAQADAVVSGDTSVLHVASALAVPLVGIYGSTRPGDNAPLFGPHVLLHDDTVPCAPCCLSRCPLRGNEHLRCLRAVTPARVLDALEQLLPHLPLRAATLPSSLSIGTPP